MENIMETIQSLLLRFGIDNVPTAGTVLTQERTIFAIIIAVLIGVIYCFFGYKSMRFITTVMGLLFGLAVGAVVATLAKLASPIDILVVVGAGLLFALLGFFLYRIFMFLSVFLVVFLVTMSMVAEYSNLDDLVIAIVALVVGIILAILAAVYLRPMIIVSTAFSGGMMLSNELFENLIHIRWDPTIESVVRISVGLILAVIGIIYQFRTTVPEEDDDEE
jgi:hypothetical protein